jgi:hypothetical protein
MVQNPPVPFLGLGFQPAKNQIMMVSNYISE